MYDFQGIPGHEFVGVVEEVDEGPLQSSDWVGRRVVGEINIACHACDLCRRGLAKHCRRRDVLGIRNHYGAFAEYLALPLSNLHKIPDDLPLDLAVFAEPLAAVFDVLNKVEVTPEARLAIVGDGRIAQMAARVLLQEVDRLTVIGKYADKLLRFPPGITTHLYDEELPDQQFDLVIECSGSTSGLATALQLIRPAGQVVLKSTVKAPLSISTETLVVNEISLIGSRCGDFERAIRFISAEQKKDQDLANLVDGYFNIEEGLAAMALAQKHSTIKVVLNMA
jgi:threonine dehydrogenase-like Zn-dependent dehydrogenase